MQRSLPICQQHASYKERVHAPGRPPFWSSYPGTLLCRGLTLNSNVEAPDLAHAWDAAQCLHPSSQDQASASPSSPDFPDQPISARVWLQQQLPGHAVRVTFARACQYVDAAARGCTIPQAASLDVCSTGRADGIQYRAGLHKVCDVLL